MPTCSQAKILTNLESGIHKRPGKLSEHREFVDIRDAVNAGPSIQMQLNELYGNPQKDINFYNYDQRTPVMFKEIQSMDGIKTVQIVHKKTGKYDHGPHNPPAASNETHHRVRGYKNPQRRISIDELQMNPFEPTPQKVLHKVPIVFNENLKKSSFSSIPHGFLYHNSQHKQQVQSRNNLFNQHSHLLRQSLKQTSDGEDENLSVSDDYNGSDQNSGDFNLSGRRGSNPKIPSLRRSIDFGQFKRSSEDSKIHLSAKSHEMSRRNSLLNQTSLKTSFPKITVDVDSVGSDAINNNINQEDPIILTCKSTNTFKSLKLDSKRTESQSLNAKRLLALASIRPSVTFHKQMTPEEILILKKYYEILKPKVPVVQENAKDEEPLPTLTYDTTKISYSNLQILKSFLEIHRKAIEKGESIIEYDINNDGAPSGFVLKAVESETVTKFPPETNDAFFAFTIMNEVSDKSETKLAEANLFRILNWNDTSVFTEKITKKPSLQTKLVINSLQSSATASLTSTSSSSTSSTPSSSVLSFDYIKNLSSLVGTIVPTKLSKQLKSQSIDISELPGGSGSDIPTFEEMGINLSNLISSEDGQNNSNGADNCANTQPAFQSSKLKVTAYKNLKEKVSATKTMWFNGPPDRKPMSVIFEYGGDEFGHEKILEEVTKCLKGTKGHVVSLEFVPRSVHLGSVYVENQWILTLDSQYTKFFTITNGIKIDNEQIDVQSYDEFIFNEFEKFIRVEKYKNLIRGHEKAVLESHKKYAKQN